MLFDAVRENSRAITGKENWLFYKGDDGQSSIPLYQNKLLFSEAQMKQIDENLRRRQAWLARQGIAFAVLAAPNKHDVYGEYYKPGLPKAGGQDRIQRLQAYLGAADCPVSFTYPLDDLLSHKKDGLLYWKTDTHWCEHGAYIGYLAWMRALRRLLPDTAPLPPERMTYEKTAKTAGDLTAMLNLKDFSAYEQDVYLAPKPIDGWPYTVLEQKTEKTRLMRIRTKAPGRPYKAVIFRDSFTTSLLPYLSSTFGEILYIWDYNMDPYAELIRREKPDIVLWECVSRSADVLRLSISNGQ